jgi:hypothetical protein
VSALLEGAAPTVNSENAASQIFVGDLTTKPLPDCSETCQSVYHLHSILQESTRYLAFLPFIFRHLST